MLTHDEKVFGLLQSLDLKGTGGEEIQVLKDILLALNVPVKKKEDPVVVTLMETMPALMRELIELTKDKTMTLTLNYAPIVEALKNISGMVEKKFDDVLFKLSSHDRKLDGFRHILAKLDAIHNTMKAVRGPRS